jgi:hypothetical protein
VLLQAAVITYDDSHLALHTPSWFSPRPALTMGLPRPQGIIRLLLCNHFSTNRSPTVMLLHTPAPKPRAENECAGDKDGENAGGENLANSRLTQTCASGSGSRATSATAARTAG